MKSIPNIRALQNGLLDALAQRLGEIEFKLSKRQQAYVRQVSDAKWFVHVAFVRHQEDVDTTIDLAIRLNKVERLLTDAGYGHSQGATFGAELGNLVDGRPQRWTVFDSSTCDSVADAMYASVRKFALPWFERHQDLEYIFSVLVSHDPMSCLYSPIPVKRCLTLVALAKHLGGTEHAQDVAQHCRAFLEARNDPQLRAFDYHVAELLKNKNTS